jgi:hypothetical protein
VTLPAWEIHNAQPKPGAEKHCATSSELTETKRTSAPFLASITRTFVDDPLGAAKYLVVGLLLALAAAFSLAGTGKPSSTQAPDPCIGCTDAVPLDEDLRPLAEKPASPKGQMQVKSQPGESIRHDG